MRMLRKGQKCEWRGCEEDAVVLACGRKDYWDSGEYRHPKVGVYCMDHSLTVEKEGYPEYTVECPNCGCGFGVN